MTNLKTLKDKYELDEFEAELLHMLEKEHQRRNHCTIDECTKDYCWFKRMKGVIIN